MNHSLPAEHSLPSRTARGRNVVLRPLRADVVERVAEIQAEPGVARWWRPPNKAQLRRQTDGSDDERAAFPGMLSTCPRSGEGISPNLPPRPAMRVRPLNLDSGLLSSVGSKLTIYGDDLR